MSMSEDDEFSHQSQLALEISRHEIRKLRARAEAAEARNNEWIERIRVLVGCEGSEAIVDRINYLRSRAEAAEAEVARLKETESMGGTLNLIIGLRDRIAALEAALIRLRDCDWVITPADRMDAVRDIARTALPDGRGE